MKGFSHIPASDVNRASRMPFGEGLQVLFQLVEVFAPKLLVPLQSRSARLPEQNGQIAVFADRVRNTHPDTSTGENDNDSRT
jgi:hypothetical protein